LGEEGSEFFPALFFAKKRKERKNERKNLAMVSLGSAVGRDRVGRLEENGLVNLVDDEDLEDEL